jgi:hypothetical protein
MVILSTLHNIIIENYIILLKLFGYGTLFIIIKKIDTLF